MDRLRGSELWVGRSSFLHWLLGGAGWTTGFSWQRVLWVDDSQWFLFRPNLAGDVMRCQWKAEAVNTFSCDFGRVKFMGFWCICSCKWCSYGTPFAISWIRFSVKNFTRIRPWPRANLSVPWWEKPRTFCNMPGVAKRPWSALCVVARSLSLRWIADWQRCRGVWVVERDGNMILGNFWRIEMEILKSCIGNSFFVGIFCPHKSKKLRTPDVQLGAGKNPMNPLLIYTIFLVDPPYQKCHEQWKNPVYFLSMGWMLLPSLSKKYYDMPLQGSEPITIMENHSQILKIPHLFMMAVSPSPCCKAFHTFTGWIHGIPCPFFWREGGKKEI